ncbi:hypothetical protein, partial [Xanthomonas codiaei]|uniref:hypothetical protein n=1 Tax=Xanthomonas codiaei TaxID=56463 RepID=UPI003D2F18B5
RMPNNWQTPLSSTLDSKPGRYSGRGDVGLARRSAMEARFATIAHLTCAETGGSLQFFRND